MYVCVDDNDWLSYFGDIRTSKLLSFLLVDL